MTTKLKTKSPLTTSSLFSTSSSWVDDAEFLYFSPNFAQYEGPSMSPKAHKWQQVPMQYEHEMYLQLTAGNDGVAEKTASQLYLEERRRRLHSQSQDPAISGPQQNCPSPIDFEAAEIERIRAVERQRESLSRSTTAIKQSNPRASSGPRTMATMMTKDDWLFWI
ncbi:hypothetical protein I7I51_01395 [Histoplasma capsulatum]|uniref:Uncharacterized protein n=1 Tax=Ajellomyces capsulatus TaxID=5037 RepID=A0A8A1MEG6_AJECA|nr:predicted protein [Histoplasma mississippiense (nom. inval.)]EDN10557.1 predicted protein [Histoplasma mississippiense (nom. inval.)]QSS64329.1 hypothetical protein I7I51_01395 [Histoplasma capsulatum]